MKKSYQKHILKIMSKKVNIVVIALSAPILIGLYDSSTNELISSYESNEKSSEYIPTLFETLLDEYNIESLAYAKGPGSFMAIKVTYVFLKTLSISLNIPFLAQDGFYFNDNTPIKAIGKLYFEKEEKNIITKTFEQIPQSKFYLPKTFKEDDYLIDTEPLYVLPAV